MAAMIAPAINVPKLVFIAILPSDAPSIGVRRLMPAARFIARKLSSRSRARQMRMLSRRSCAPGDAVRRPAPRPLRPGARGSRRLGGCPFDQGIDLGLQLVIGYVLQSA